jgi:hypothetical protein
MAFDMWDSFSWRRKRKVLIKHRDQRTPWMRANGTATYRQQSPNWIGAFREGREVLLIRISLLRRNCSPSMKGWVKFNGGALDNTLLKLRAGKDGT